MDDFLSKVLLDRDPPDCLLLSKLTKQRLQISGTRVVVPKATDVAEMRKILAENMRYKNLHRLLGCSSKKELCDLIRFMRERLNALDDYERWRQLIEKKESGASIEVENLVDNELLPPNLIYITVCIPVVARSFDAQVYETKVKDKGYMF